MKRFSETSEILSKLFKNLKDRPNINNFSIHTLKFSETDNCKENSSINDVISKKSLDSSKKIQCAYSDSFLTLDLLTHSNRRQDLSIYRENKDFIISSFITLINLKTKNHDLLSFLCDSLTVIVNDLNFDELYRLVKVISNEKSGKSHLSDKISTIFCSLLTRVNYLITEKLSYTKGIVKVNELPKYSAGYLHDSGSDITPGINFDCEEHLEKLWHLWYILSKKSFHESKYTVSLLLSLLELETGRIFKFDLRRVCRALDIVVGDCKFFSKLEERFILRLLKRFSIVLSNLDNDQDPELHLKSNNITPIQVKKFFCNISKISKISPKLLENFLQLENSYKSFQNFVTLSSFLLNNEHGKLDVSERNHEHSDSDLTEYFNKNSTELNYKHNKLFLKVFVDSVEIVKFLDHLILCRTPDSDSYNNLNNCEELRNKLLKLSYDLLIKISVEAEEYLVQECRSMYYILLTFSLYKPTIPDTLGASELSETISNKIERNITKLTSNSRLLTGHTHSSENNNLGMKTVQFMLFCDKINCFLRLLGSNTETSNKVNLSCKKLVMELLKNHEKLLSSNQTQGLKTLYVTLLNKYGLLSPEIYCEFLHILEPWPTWKRNELTMLCDLFSRTYPNYCTNTLSRGGTPDNQHFVCSRVLDRILSLLESLIKYVFVNDNFFKFSNKELISVLNFLNTYLDAYNDKLTPSDSFNLTFNEQVKSMITNKLSERINVMNFNQLVKLLSFHNIIEESFRDEIVQGILNLDYLGDISCLVSLNDPTVTSKVLNTFDIKVVDESYVFREKMLKMKFLNNYKKPQVNENIVSHSNYEALKMLI
eukprot:XP_766605.1 hypothetical protein [Theileria parva strain Muguga]